MSTAIANQLFLAYLGRPADSAWQSSTASLLNGSAPSAALQGAFYNAAVAEGVFSATDSNSTLVNKIFLQTFGFAASTFEQTAWSNLVDTGVISKATLAWTIFSSYMGATNVPAAYQQPAQSKLIAIQAYTAQLLNDGTANLALSQGGTAATSARTSIATVTTAAQAATYVTGIAANVASSAVTAGQTFTLTTGVDVSGTLESTSKSTSTAGNDTFNATSATLNSFDNINGGAGTDTFNYAETGTALFALPAALTLAGLENIVVSRINTGTTTGEVAITNTTFGTGVTSLSYTDASAATAMTGATVAVTLASATAVTVAATGAGTFTTVAVTDTSAAAASTGSKLTTVSITKASGANTLTGNGITTLNLEATGGLTTVTAAAGTRALTVNTSGTTTLGGLTDATATTLNINVAGAAALGTITTAKATTVNYSSTAANVSGTLTAAAATTLNVSGTKLATLTLTGNTALATVNVTGTAGLTTDLTAGATAVTLLDTSGTTGTTTATVNLATAVTGGAGNDHITVGATTKTINLGGGTAVAAVSGTSNAVLAANTVTLTSGTTALGTGGSINGGTGTADELILVNADAVTLSAANAVTTAFKAAVTGFETLNIGTQTGSTVDVGKMGTFTTVKMTTAAAAQVLAGVTSGQTIEAVFGAGGTSITTNSLTAGSDTLTLKLSGDLSGGARAFGILATPGAETVNIVTNDTNLTFTTRQATATLNNTNATSIVVTGNNGLTLTHNLADGTTASTNLHTLDASGLTKGAIVYTSGVLTTDATVRGSLLGGDTLNFAASVAAVNMTATAGTNTLRGSTTIASTLTGGTGADTIFGGSGADTIVGGAGADTIYADNAGTKGVRTLTSVDATIAAGETMIAVINGTTVTYTMTTADVAGNTAADLLASTTKLAAAINADANLSKLVVATNALGVVTITSISDGVLAISGISTDTIAMTASAASGSVGTTANNVILAERAQILL